MIREYNEYMQKFLMNEKQLFENDEVNKKKDYFYPNTDLNETKNTEIADIYEDLNIPHKKKSKNLKLEDFNILILELIESHTKLDDELDEFLEKLEPNVNFTNK